MGEYLWAMLCDIELGQADLGPPLGNYRWRLASATLVGGNYAVPQHIEKKDGK